MMGRSHPAAALIATHVVSALLVISLFASCGKRDGAGPPADSARVEVETVGFDQQAGTPFVALSDRAGGRSLQITIGADEARTITLELSGIKTPRPLTAELLRKVIARTGNAVDRVEITRVSDGVYFARIILNRGRLALDSRPSDAIALALGTRAPIYAAIALMRPAGAKPGEAATPATATNFGVTVQELTPDLAQYFDVEAGSGVLVAESNRLNVLLPGDIVIEAGGRLMRATSDFARLSMPDGAPLAMTVRRDGITRTLTLPPPVAASPSRPQAISGSAGSR
jgi:bifunctional DNase/RNase